MGWPYRFDVDLTKEQKHLRRYYLDWYASLAQVSAFVPVLAFLCYFLVTWVYRRWQSNRDLETPSSPYVKEQWTHEKTRRIANVLLRYRRFAWWCGDSLDAFGYHLGTKGAVLGAVIWTAWLLLLCFLQTGDDYYHLTKRFGIVGASQLPFHYLLAFKSPYSPLQMLTRSSHETLNVLHQLLGRIVTVLFYLHAIFYINFFVQANRMADKIKEAYIICGIVGVVAFTAVGTTALAPLRRWSYRIFYITHVTLAIALLPILYFHVHHIRIYVYETAVVYALNIVLRLCSTRTFPGSIKAVTGTKLVEIRLTPPEDFVREKLGQWQPGQHAYVSLAGHPFQRTFRSNPFTVASIPSVDGQLHFVARVLDGNTAKLAQSAKNGSNSHMITVEGPYGVATHADRLLRYDRVLLVAGGVGATFIVPLYRQLLADLSPSKGSYRRQKVSFLWIARSMADVIWAVPDDKIEKEGFAERVSVCITGNANDRAEAASGSFAIGDDDADNGPGLEETEEGIELEEQKKLLSAEPTDTTAKAAGEIPLFAGRPDLRRVVEQTFAQDRVGRVAILVCGPRSLSQALRKEVRPWVAQGRDVWFWEEHYAL